MVKDDPRRLKAEKDFSREAVLWRQLSHPNLLPFYGVYHFKEDRNRVCMVSPWMENGNVKGYLEGNPDANRISLVRTRNPSALSKKKQLII
jgi:serine/threonine protein kinase